MKTFSRRLCQLVIVMLLAAGQSPLAASPNSVRAVLPAVTHPKSAASEQNLQPLDSLLQADGTLNLPTSFSGSLDPRGWRMMSELGQPPRFVRLDRLTRAVSDSGSYGATASGDENWDDVAPAHAASYREDAPSGLAMLFGNEQWDERFDALGFGGTVQPIAVLGSNVITVPQGFTVTTFPIGIEIDGLAPAPGGMYGTDLYVAVNGAVLRVNPSSGAFTTFATGLAAGPNRPSSLAFDSGTFGTSLLYISQNNGSVVTISPTGTVSSFSSGGTLFSSNDLAFAPPAGAFGNNLFVSNGSFGSGNISRVDSQGVNTVFAPISKFAQVPVGLAFPPVASAFGSNLFASVANGTLVQVNSLANVTTFTGGAGLAIDLAFSKGRAFGHSVYVSDPNSQSILRVDSDGAVSTFATGFSFTLSGFDADLAFSNDGNTLFIANGSEIIKITGENIIYLPLVQR